MIKMSQWPNKSTLTVFWKVVIEDEEYAKIIFSMPTKWNLLGIWKGCKFDLFKEKIGKSVEIDFPEIK